MSSSTSLLERCLTNEIYRKYNTYVSFILLAYKTHIFISADIGVIWTYRLWLDGILPLVCDRESSMQEKCLQILYDLTWAKIVKTEPEGGQPGWQLVSLIVNHDNPEAKYVINLDCLYWKL